MSDSKHARPTLVLLVRHGLTETTGRILPGRAPGLHLSEAGRRQAEAAAARIAALGGVGAVYSSPRERARETAEAISAVTGRSVVVNEGLDECDFGIWTGKPLADLRKSPEWQDVQRRPDVFRFPSGESFEEMQARAWETVEGLAARHQGETLVAVSHADVIKAVACKAAGSPLDCFQRIVVGPASITALAFADSFPLVLTLNSTGDDLKALKVQ